MHTDELLRLEERIHQDGWDQPALFLLHLINDQGHQVAPFTVTGHPRDFLMSLPPLPPQVLDAVELTLVTETWQLEYSNDPEMGEIDRRKDAGELTTKQAEDLKREVIDRKMGEIRERGMSLADIPGAIETRMVLHMHRHGGVTVVNRHRGGEPFIVDEGNATGFDGVILHQLRRIKGEAVKN